MTFYAYLRVSSETQQTARQEAASWLSGISSECVYVDKASGKNMDRPAWQELMSKVSAGDEIHAHELSRIGRSLSDLTALADDLMGRGVVLVIHKEGIRLEQNNLTSKLIFGILGSIAAWERETIKERQREGIEAIKADPEKRAEKYKGRQRTATESSRADQIERLLIEGLKPQQIAEQTGAGIATVYRIKKALTTEQTGL
ncbi:recombinase family protein [Aeromonas jandaei]|uniref:recombinase family protein n=1 Tax=Aeromonas jandaei TaxID=650 RepID=UPI0036726442